ncbi:hypothetical protein [Nocardia arthritidis]|uniref:Uncharacterized protein n=1 Tax=Nocardia arthritidis TaxID=228602 RepID=A0A6G9YPL1_9NOCA|nr:hypothetical protein [Nocardia arthritidis]QIS15131.1 hypothetical protein F5544_36515 [Nocardia arthritidis]
MNGITNFSANCVAVDTSVSASRGFLALQGIGLSFDGAFVERLHLVNKHVIDTQSPIRTVEQDKPSAGWQHPVTAKAVSGAFVIEAGYAPAPMRAARLRRTAHPASVIRGRHRCRPR